MIYRSDGRDWTTNQCQTEYPKISYYERISKELDQTPFVKMEHETNDLEIKPQDQNERSFSHLY